MKTTLFLIATFLLFAFFSEALLQRERELHFSDRKLGANATAVAGWVTKIESEKRRIMTRHMSFQKCLAIIRKTSGSLGTPPTNIVETEIMRMVRFNSNDGTGDYILLTCSKIDQKLIMLSVKA